MDPKTKKVKAPVKKVSPARTVKVVPTEKLPKVAKAVKITKLKAKKTITKKPVKLPALKVAKATKVKTIKEAVVVKDEVNLPTNMSLRAIEKSAVFSSELEAYVRSSAFKIAYVSGLCFILIGATFSANLFIPNLNALSMSGTVTNALSTTDITPVLNTNSVFSFISAPPNKLSEPTTVKFSLTNTAVVSSKLIRVGQTGFYDLETNKLTDDKYSVVIPATSLPPGYYQLRVFNINSITSAKGNYDSQVFQVGEPVEDMPPVEVIDVPEEPEVDKPTEIVPVANPFEIFSTGSSILSGISTIGIKLPADASYVELYARPLQSLSSRFVALATKRFEQLRFDFDSTNIPNGDYEFFAKAKLNGEVITTKSLKFKVSNSSYVAETQVTTETQVTAEKETVRPLITVEDTIYIAEPVVENDIARETNKLIADNETELNKLLQLYATARQSGNQILIDSAQESIKQKREDIIFNILQDQSTRDIADEIDVELEKIVSGLEAKVDSFEQIRKDRSEGLTAKDTDSDGISDFDEVNIYATDPESSDSDKDGVIDGIELVKGFNPLDSSSEAVIEFKSPQQSVGLVRNDLMKINNVVPIVEVGSDDNGQIVKAEISGKALPNSFVTLFIFSSPTVVTIKTDADGSFAYTFNKELEDGQHEIYVAITDNTGEIIAQSSPFSFVKQAQAFTPVDAEKEEITTAANTNDQASKDAINVVGIGILALGIILIMLGVSLRSKNEVVVMKNDNYIDAT